MPTLSALWVWKCLGRIRTSHLYWAPKLHKTPFKHSFIAGSSKCTTKDLCLFTKLLSTIKNGLIRYCATKTSRNGLNNMWILKNSICLLSSLDQLDVRTATSMQTYDFSTLYTSIPNKLLKSQIASLVHNSFKKKDGGTHYTHIKVGQRKGYFINFIIGGRGKMYTADQICNMIDFLAFIKFGGCLCRQSYWNPYGNKLCSIAR